MKYVKILIHMLTKGKFDQRAFNKQVYKVLVILMDHNIAMLKIIYNLEAKVRKLEAKTNEAENENELKKGEKDDINK